MSLCALDSWYPEDARTCLTLANILLVLHFAVVIFVLAGQALILIGGSLKWSIVRNRWFRASHLAVIAAVTLIAALGELCPLTIWENELRARAGESVEQTSFVAHWAHELIFVEVEVATLRWLYGAFGLLVLGSVVLFPVDWSASSPGRDVSPPASEP